MPELPIEIIAIYLSKRHDFKGHYGRARGNHGEVSVKSVDCVAGRGLRGDRYFDYQENFKGQITFIDFVALEKLRNFRAPHDFSLSVVRRNVVTSGVDLKQLIGHKFEIDGVLFAGTEECRPCHWMNVAVGPGAEEFLKFKGRGGLRARILRDGCLRIGKANIAIRYG